MAPEKNNPARPESGPGCGRELQELIDRLEARITSVVTYQDGKPYTMLGPDPDCMEAAKWLRKLTGGRG